MQRTSWKALWIGLLACGFVHAESQTPDYPGVGDPFGDPSQYEFAEEEKSDKEFFHLGRFMMFGVDMGAGIYTGGLGSTAAPAFAFGGKVLYFFDKSVAFEGRVTYSMTQEAVITTSSGTSNLDTSLLGFGAGFRYYFDAKSAPRAIAIANPYLALGGGVYVRQSTYFADGSTTDVSGTIANGPAFGANAGGGVEFLIYRKHVYLGLDLRYHLIMFSDEGSTLGGAVAAGDRAGDYFTALMTVSYSF